MGDPVELPDLDLDALRAERRYPAFGPEDDDFHDEAMSDRWWETETQWFSWNVPERRMGGWTYCQSRPNADLCNGGAWVWDDAAALSWDLPYHAHYNGLQLPPRAERDLRDFAWPNGVEVRTLEPLTSYAIAYSDPGGLELDLRFDALIAPNPHPVGVVPFLKGVHFDQPGRLVGTMVLRGEEIAVDCFSVRDRSWGPRPAGRPKPRPAASPPRPAFGIGYCFGTAGPRDAWLMYSVPGLDDDPVTCGFLLRDGEYAHLLGGRRRLQVDPATGWPTRIDAVAVDDLGRRLEVTGEAVSRHWKGHGGDTLLRWTWDGLEGWGEDQTYLSREVCESYRRAAGAADRA
jgi:hypothetical protein